MRSLRDSWRLAVGTLTVLPVPPPLHVDRAVAGPAMLLAPLAALPLALLPLLAHLAHVALGMPPLLAAALGVAGLALGSRGLHLDGLADTVDGLAASTDRERALTVMRRGDVGPLGAAAVALVLLVQAAAWSALVTSRTGTALAVVAVLGSRHTLAWTCGPSFPAARPGGLGATVAGSVPRSWAGLGAGGLWVIGGLVLTLGAGGPSWHAWVATGAVVTVAVLAALGLSRRARRRLGGTTGDVLGAAVEIGLAAALTVAACLG